MLRFLCEIVKFRLKSLEIIDYELNIEFFFGIEEKNY